MLSQSIDELLPKRNGLLNNCQSITAVAVGSSHGDYGFNPAYAPGAFNLCSTSQDLKHSSCLYEFTARICPSLQYVIIFYSLFSSGFFLEKISEKIKCASYKEIFALDVDYLDDEITSAYETIKGTLNYTPSGPASSNGFIRNNQDFFFPDTFGVDKRVSRHLAINSHSEANQFLVRLLFQAEALGHKTIVVIPPVRSDYRAAINNSSEYLFRGLFEIQNKMHPNYEFQVVNLFDSKDFKDEYFGDFDHLLPENEGCIKLSGIISQLLEK